MPEGSLLKIQEPMAQFGRVKAEGRDAHKEKPLKMVGSSDLHRGASTVPLTIAEKKRGPCLALPPCLRRNLAASAEPVEIDDVVAVDGWFSSSYRQSK
jgi:hypothetical protein